MPLFDYKCPWCDHIDRDVLEPAETLWRWCKSCHEEYMERMPSAPAFSIKGYSAANGYSKGAK